MCSDGMSQTSTAATRYNDGTSEVRSTQLRSAKVEEARIAELAKSRFEQLSTDIQSKLNSAPQ
jgi:hypothetical protein